ncbi:MAG: efflux RND transporter permease subunit [Bacteriovoracaceae bacterium]|nr:efflux RND transporter permease subunit [Bacteriovoracaceae bacterium]
MSTNQNRSLWAYAVRRPVFAWMFMLSLILFGIIGYLRLGIARMPDVDFPVVNISVRWAGAAPEIIENEVVDVMESSLAGVEGVKSINSNTKRGEANITVEFELNRDINIGVQEIQAKIGQAQRSLPKDIDPPIVTKSNPEDRPIMWISVTADKIPRHELMAYVRDNIRDRFQNISGVSDIILGGYIDPNLRIWMNPQTMKQFDLTPLDVANAVQEQHQEVPGGSVDLKNQELIVRADGEAKTVEEFLNISLLKRGGGINYTSRKLKDIASVELGLDDVKRIGRVNGKTAIGLGIRKVRGSNAVAVGDQIKEKLEQIKKTLPPGFDMGVNYDGTTFIKESIDELTFTILLSSVLTAFIVWLFIGSWSASFNIILSIPTVIIGTLFFMQWMGFTLNTFSMLGLILAVGIVVDDNIMVLENITRMGKTIKDRGLAAIAGTDQIASAAIATSIAMVAIFLPIGYMRGIVGKFFYEFAVTFTFCILLSTLDALIFTPMRYSQVGKKSGEDLKEVKWLSTLTEYYKRSLKWSLDRPKLTIFFSFLFFLPVLILPKFITKEFTPAQDQSILMVMLKTKAGSSLSFTNEKALKVEKILSATPEARRYYLTVGGMSGNESNSAFIYLSLLPKKDRPLREGQKKIFSHEDVANELREKISKEVPGIFAVIQDPSKQGFGGGSANYDIDLSVIGPEWNVLARLSNEGKALFKESGLVVDVDTDFKGIVPELLITPQRDKASMHGISIQAINQTIDAAIRGKVLGKYSKDGRRFDVRLKYQETWLQDLAFIKTIPIINNRGETITLDQVANIEVKDGLLSTRREDRQRKISLSGNVAGKLSHDVVMEKLKAGVQKILPSGYVVTESGQSKEFLKTMREFLFVFLLGIVVAYIVLASQYNSFLDPVIILLALPFSLTGAFVALYVSGVSLNIYSLIGIILLMGIVKKNSILLVEFTNQTLEENPENGTKHSVKDALMYACPIRFRPIIMTSVTTIVGALPAAFALGPGAETKIPLAVTIMGGVIFSTILTLYLVPTAYAKLKK